MKKRALALVLALGMAAALMTGCGSSKPEPSSQTPAAGAEKLNDALNEAVQDALSEVDLSEGEEKAASSVTDGVSGQAAQALASLESDFTKVNWGVSYQPDGIEGLVISVAPMYDGYSWFLLVAMTNLYDNDIEVFADGTAKNAADEEIGNLVIYEEVLGSGNTTVGWCFCDDMPDGRISWSEVSVDTADAEYVPWESDWSLKGSDQEWTIGYHLYAADGATDMHMEDIMMLVLDKDGNILAFGDDYISEDAAGKDGYDGELDLFAYAQSGEKPADAAIFINPVKK